MQGRCLRADARENPAGASEQTSAFAAHAATADRLRSLDEIPPAWTKLATPVYASEVWCLRAEARQARVRERRRVGGTGLEPVTAGV